ncbi:O-antigen ligase family protein, partial [Rhodopirellula bahusiensis]
LAIGLLAERLQRFGSAWPRMIFNDAAFAWLIAAIGIMLSSLLICVSRGGVLSAFLAICIVGALRFRIAEAGRSVLLAVLIGVPLATMLIWVGFNLQESRLSMLTESDRYSTDGRWHLWEAALVSVPQFLWFGSGGETYQFWETIHHAGDVSWNQSDMYSLRADNEFLDVLSEYGLVGLVGLSLMAAAVCVQSFRSSRQSGLAAGGAIGLLAVLMHSMVDFGLRVPATGVMALVVTMLLCSQTPRTPGNRSSKHSLTRKKQPRSSGVPAYAQLAASGSTPKSISYVQWTLLAVVVVTIAFSSIRIRRRYFEAENARRSAQEHIENLAYDEALSTMEHAVTVIPEDALMRMEAVRVAEYVRDHFQSQRQKNAATKMIVDHSQVLMQQCPLDWKAYTWRAQHDSTLDPASQLAFIRKARSLHPGQPDLAYLAGKLELAQGSIETALPHWQESLSVSRKHLPQICQMMQGRLSTEQWTNELLPEDPVVTFATATELPSPLRESILERTLTLLANPDRLSRKPSPGQWDALRGETLAELKQYDRGIAMMRRGINEQPDNIDWRLKLATWCLREQRLEEAVREIRIALTLEPDNRKASELQKIVSQEKARLQSPQTATPE